MRGSSHSLMSSGMGGGGAQQQQQQMMMAAAHAQRQHEMRALVASAQERMAATARREKMKKLMQSAANERGEVPVDDVLLTAELANVALDPQQKELIFRTPYAQRYATTYDVTSERTVYGLESTPRSVNWRQFDAAMRAPSLGDPSRVEAALKRYADTEAAAIAEQRRRDEEAEALAKARALASNMPVEKARGISDDELRMVHKMVKTRLSTQFAQIREAFRSFDTDHSGNISAKECADALLSLNVGVPRKFIDHLVNIADTSASPCRRRRAPSLLLPPAPRPAPVAAARARRPRAPRCGRRGRPRRRPGLTRLACLPRPAATPEGPRAQPRRRDQLPGACAHPRRRHRRDQEGGRRGGGPRRDGRGEGRQARVQAGHHFVRCSSRRARSAT